MRGLIRLPAGVLIGVILTAACVPAQHPAPQGVAQIPAPTTAACRAGHRDDFTGANLDRARWTTVVRETQNLRVAGGNLVIPTTNTDIIAAPGSDIYTENLTPNLVLQALPQGPFTATAKLTLLARAPYQQAGLVIYGDDDNYAKLVFHAREEDVSERYVVLVREDKGQVVEHSLTEALGEEFPDSVWLRFTSDGQTLRAAYSADGKTFTDVPEDAEEDRPLRLAGGATPKLGLLALAGGLAQAPVIDAKFHWFELCPGGDAAR